MISAEEMTQTQLRRAAHSAVARELGVVGLIRYLRTITPCEGDYTRDRWEILPKYESLDEYFADVESTTAAMREKGLIP